MPGPDDADGYPSIRRPPRGDDITNTNIRIITSHITICKYDYDRYYPAAFTELLLIRFRLAAILERRRWTPYRLARATGLTVPTAYRLADTGLQFGRFTADTLDRLCAALEVQPGDLLEWVPDQKRRRRD
jgi:putative transcriptional regulator